MGPRSENRGYTTTSGNECGRDTSLQWVHGQRTVVTLALDTGPAARDGPSMGPRSENRGYRPTVRQGAGRPTLQWVHGQRTVVTARRCGMDPDDLPFNGSTVREPWLRQGVGAKRPGARAFNGSTVREPWLQGADAGEQGADHPSMGPRSENRGY